MAFIENSYRKIRCSKTCGWNSISGGWPAFETTVGRNKQLVEFVQLRESICAVPAIGNADYAGTASAMVSSIIAFASDLFRPTRKTDDFSRATCVLSVAIDATFRVLAGDYLEAFLEFSEPFAEWCDPSDGLSARSLHACSFRV